MLVSIEDAPRKVCAGLPFIYRSKHRNKEKIFDHLESLVAMCSRVADRGEYTGVLNF